MANILWTRRRVLGAALTGVAALPLTRIAAASGLATPAERWIELVNLHTSEVASVAFRGATGYVTSALNRLHQVLRDHRTGEAHPIDPALFDQLSELARAAGREPRFEIISGYRSPATNAKLNANSNGVAKRSLHMEGRALDVRLKSCSCAQLRDLALAAQRGGVGYYARSNFVHLDTGRVRSWLG
jgi:uncharacterized protein YcbK (DUF882 family)